MVPEASVHLASWDSVVSPGVRIAGISKAHEVDHLLGFAGPHMPGIFNPKSACQLGSCPKWA